jgi:uncharacterized protein (TIGR00730 family)
MYFCMSAARVALHLSPVGRGEAALAQRYRQMRLQGEVKIAAATCHCKAQEMEQLDGRRRPMSHQLMSLIKRVCVYCGSNQGRDPRFVAAARRFGEILAVNGVGLVYGCGSIGLMGTIARAVHDHGGEVIGVIPEFLKVQERLFTDASEIVITADMHERKRTMFERADAFVALPGGVGTLEEVVEQLTWAQLGRHRKPILFANIAGFWDPLLVMFEHLLSLGFLTNGRLGFLVADNVDDILPTLTAAAAKVTEVEKLGEPERVERL